MKIGNQISVLNAYKNTISNTKNSKKNVEDDDSKEKKQLRTGVEVTISEEGKKLSSKKYSNLRIMKINGKVYH